MGDFTINLKDYISEERIAEIAEEEVRKSLRVTFSNESAVTRILGNMSYHCAYKIVDDEFAANGQDLKKSLVEMMKEVINDANTMRFCLFRDGRYGEGKSLAYKVMEEEVRNARPLIRECVENHISKYPFHELDKDEISDTISKVIMEKLNSATVNTENDMNSSEFSDS